MRVNSKAVIIGVAALAAPALMLIFIHHYGVNAPFWDEWGELSVVFKAYDGTLDWASFLAQQNEHRPVTSKIVSVVLARTTQLNLVDEMYLGFAFEFLALILIWRMLATGLRDRARVLIWPLTIVASLFLFWTVAFENWTWGIASFQYLSSVFWAVATIWGLTMWHGRWTGVIIACVSTTVAIYTTGCGFALIPVGILGILAYGMSDREIPWLHVGLFGIVAAVCTALYLTNYTSPEFFPPPSLARIRPLQMVRYFLTYLGSPFWTAKGGIALSFGLLGFAGISACAYYIIRFMQDWIECAIPWFLLGSYSVINAALTSFARIDFGVEQALAPRYRSIVVLLWISLVVTSSMILVHIGPRFNRGAIRAAITVAIMLSIGGYSYLYYRGFRHIRLRSQLLADGLPYLMEYDKAPDDKLRIFHPDPSAVRDLSRRLEQYHLGPFADRRTHGAANREAGPE